MARPTRKTQSQLPAQAPAPAAPALVVKFYHQENCNRKLKVGPVTISFQPYQLLCGCWSGTFSASNPEIQACVAKLMEVKSNCITEISEADFKQFAKVRLVEARKNTELIVPPPPSPTSGILDDIQAEIVRQPTGELPPPEPVVTVAPLASVDEAVTVGSVEQAQIVK